MRISVKYIITAKADGLQTFLDVALKPGHLSFQDFLNNLDEYAGIDGNGTPLTDYDDPFLVSVVNT